MRARLVRPELCLDPDVGQMPDALQLFYVKLWMWCDDEGYFESDPAAIGAALYPFKKPAVRKREVEKWLELLREAGKALPFECGEHGVVPSIPRYRFQGGKHSSHVKRRHEASCTVRSRFGAGSPSSSSSSSSSETLVPRDDYPQGEGPREVEVPEHLRSAPWNRRGSVQ